MEGEPVGRREEGREGMREGGRKGSKDEEKKEEEEGGREMRERDGPSDKLSISLYGRMRRSNSAKRRTSAVYFWSQTGMSAP
jgi:hypothetical protein